MAGVSQNNGTGGTFARPNPSGSDGVGIHQIGRRYFHNRRIGDRRLAIHPDTAPTGTNIVGQVVAVHQIGGQGDLTPFAGGHLGNSNGGYLGIGIAKMILACRDGHTGHIVHNRAVMRQTGAQQIVHPDVVGRTSAPVGDIDFPLNRIGISVIRLGCLFDQQVTGTQQYRSCGVRYRAKIIRSAIIGAIIIEKSGSRQVTTTCTTLLHLKLDGGILTGTSKTVVECPHIIFANDCRRTGNRRYRTAAGSGGRIYRIIIETRQH